MAFGYMLLKGRQGVTGHIRENGNQREVTARGLQPGAECSFYVLEKGTAMLCTHQAADREGNARFTVQEPGPLFLAVNGKPVLWTGGEDTLLQASAWAEKQKKAEKEIKMETPPEIVPVKEEKKPDPIPEAVPEKKPEPLPSVETVPPETLVVAQERTEQSSSADESFRISAEPLETENPPEQAYILRPAGSGEPVDALPRRSRS